MTAIAAIYQGGRAWMASDSRQHGRGTYRDDCIKIRRIGAALVGLAGSPLYDNALMDAPPLEPDANEAGVLLWCVKLAQRLRAYGKEQGHGDIGGGIFSHDFALLIATTAGLWDVEGDGSVARVARDWHAIGSGGAEARGSIHGQLDLCRCAGDLDYESVVATAIRSAIALDSSCGGNVHMVSL